MMKQCDWPMLDGRYISMHKHQICVIQGARDEFMATYNCFLVLGCLQLDTGKSLGPKY